MPLFVTATCEFGRYDDPNKKSGAEYAVLNKNGGAIEVIWSRRAANETEIQRYVVHFEVARIDGVWKVVGIQSRNTDVAYDKDSIENAWQF